MASLRELLNSILPKILPKNPGDAISGTKLMEQLLRENKGLAKYKEPTFRTHFSVMAGDPTSPIARVDQGHGYYRREITHTIAPETEPNNLQAESEAVDPEESRRAQQFEEKFRSLYIRWSTMNDRFPIHIEHTKASRQKAGINKWKFPDVVVVDWAVGEATDQGLRFSENLHEVKRSLGEQSFALTSVELKVDLTALSLRQTFFQCVSNSKWAHRAELAIAGKISDATIANELRRLGTSYDVSVVQFNLDRTFINDLPDAEVILKMKPAEIENFGLSDTPLVTGSPREGLDWQHFDNLKEQSGDMQDLSSWIARCIKDRKFYSVEEWRHLMNIESRHK